MLRRLRLRRAGALACQELVELASDYLEGALPASDRDRIEAHLRACDGCTEYLAQLRRTIEITGRLAPEALEPAAREQLLVVFREWRSGGS
jgi:anti-sigma factor RsiW